MFSMRAWRADVARGILEREQFFTLLSLMNFIEIFETVHCEYENFFALFTAISVASAANWSFFLVWNPVHHSFGIRQLRNKSDVFILTSCEIAQNNYVTISRSPVMKIIIKKKWSFLPELTWFQTFSRNKNIDNYGILIL